MMMGNSDMYPEHSRQFCGGDYDSFGQFITALEPSPLAQAQTLTRTLAPTLTLTPIPALTLTLILT